jgi:hypothetical protein
MARRLSDFDPRMRGGFLVFDCPTCAPQGNAHGIRVPLAPQQDQHGQSWQYSGEFPETISLTPSVDAGCWHGFITNGDVTP